MNPIIVNICETCYSPIKSAGAGMIYDEIVFQNAMGNTVFFFSNSLLPMLRWIENAGYVVSTEMERGVVAIKVNGLFEEDGEFYVCVCS